MIKTREYQIQKVEFQEDYLRIVTTDFELKVAFEDLSERLKKASNLERQIFTVSPSGYGIHWPLIDEDLAIDAIIRDFKS
jgi:hypothetical protein